MTFLSSRSPKVGHVHAFEQFDRIRIVSLPERRDRRAEMMQELRTIGLEGHPKVAFFDAYRISGPGLFRSVGSHGCYLSHLEILAAAAAEGESVLILQDDCRFLPEIQSYQIPQCDIFYGGYEATTHPDEPHKSEIVGAHFMGFSVEAARKASSYLRALLDPAFPPDPDAAAQPGFNPRIRPPIDGALVWFRRAHPELVTIFARLSEQRPSRSDVAELKFFDRIPVLRELTGVGRKLKRWLGG